MNHDWMKDPRLANISPEKKALLIRFGDSLVPGMNKQQMLAAYMQLQKQMQAQKLSLTGEEGALMIELLKESMSDKEKAKLNQLLAKFGPK